MDLMNPFTTNAPQVLEPAKDPASEPGNDPNANPNDPVPAPVTQEEFKELQDKMTTDREASNKIISDLNSQVLQSNQLMQNGIAQYTPSNATDPADQITEAQVTEAMANGEPSAVPLMQKYIQQSGKAELDSLKSEMKKMREDGQRSLSQLAHGAGTQNLTFYDKYKEEIDAVAKTADQTNPETYRQAHNFVVGQHMDEIIEQAKEEAIRGHNSNEPGSVTTPNSGSSAGRNLENGKIDLSHQNVFSQAALNQLRMRGVTPEQHAKNLNFDSYEEFAKYKLGAEGRMISNEPTNA